MNIFSNHKHINIIRKNENIVKKYSLFFLGCLLTALSYNLFISPNRLIPGGVGGIAIIINSQTGIDNSTIILIINLLLLCLSYIIMGKEKTKATILGTLIVPIFIKLTEHVNVWIGLDTSQILLSTIFGGILTGIGLGLVFKQGFTTGGTDIINQIFAKIFKIGIGQSMLLTDGLIVLVSGFFFGIYNVLYSIVLLYIISFISDKIILGISDNKMIYIVSNKDEEIRKYIKDNLNHGLTIYKGIGESKNVKKRIIMTVIPTKDLFYIEDFINSIDQEAFYIITDAYELFGGE